MEDEKSFRIRKLFLMNYLQMKQEEYESFWVRNVWGFGDKMRDYLLEGLRRIHHG